MTLACGVVCCGAVIRALCTPKHGDIVYPLAFVGNSPPPAAPRPSRAMALMPSMAMAVAIVAGH